MELIAQVVLEQIKAANSDLRKTLDGLSAEALNWRPPAPETSSLYVLGMHMIGVQRSMVGLAAGKTVQRDRASEFRAVGDEVGTLLAALDRAEKDVEEWLGSVTAATLAEPRSLFGREVPAAACLAYALRHLGEHVGHAGLTRQLWERASGPQGRRSL
ncbi:MAG: DinB family protein [Chloroflexi bacterium]|nr:DinB family protein [Chloroflexota bacterium]